MKKLLGIICVAFMLVSLGVSAYADDMIGSPDPMNVFFESADGIEVGNNWVGLGIAVDNDGVTLGITENATMYDITEQAELGNYLVVIYTATNEGCPVISYNHAQADTYGVDFSVFENGNEYVAYVNMADVWATFSGNDYEDIAIKIGDENAVIYAVYALEVSPIKTVTTEDVSPKTGVSLALIPIAIGAAVAVVSKKR